MREIVIVTDSTSDLSPELYQKFNIEVMPLYVIFDKETYKDGIDISGELLYRKVEELGVLPKTSGASPGDFYNFFNQFISQGKDVIFMGIGGSFSVTTQSAKIVADEFEEGRVTIIDSENLSSGIGLLLIKMAKYRDQGLSIPEIKAKIEEIRPKVKSQFVIESLDYLHRGGRCSATANFFGKVFGIKPLIIVRNGTMGVGKKIFGSIKKAMKFMYSIFESELVKNNVDLDCVLVTSTCASKNEEYIRSLLANDLVTSQVKNIYYTEAGSVIASHCGKGTIGILYITKNGRLAENNLVDQD